MFMANADIRAAAKKATIPFWRIAQEVNVSESTFTRKMRIELSEAEKTKILEIIKNLSKEAENHANANSRAGI